MAKIVISREGEMVAQHFLEGERVVIGRAPDCDVVIDARQVSKHHAAIVPVVNDHFIEDLGSTNGLVVNGKRVARHLLFNGDVVYLGPFRLKYINAASVGVGFDRTLMMPTGKTGLPASDGTLTPAMVALDKASAVAHVNRERFPLGVLRGLEGTYAGAELDLSDPLFSLGRREKGLVLINRRPRGYYVTHLDGPNGRVGGRLISSEPTLLHAGEVLEVGGESLVFELLEESRSEASPPSAPRADG